MSAPARPLPGRRAPLPGSGWRGGLLALGTVGVLAAADAGSRPLLALAVGAVQLLLTLAWLALLDAPGGLGAFAIALAAAFVADGVLLGQDAPRLGGLAGVVGLALVASGLQQLARRLHRARVTDALAATLSSVLLACAVSCLVALRAGPQGRSAVAAGAVAAGVSLTAGRLGDWLAPRPAIEGAPGRGVVGLVASVAAGAATGWLVARVTAGVSPGTGAALGLIAALVAAIADLTLVRLAPEIDPDDERRAGALAPLAPLLPLALACPAIYVAGRLLLG